MKVILVFCILFVHALARPGIFGEDGIVHKAVEKAHEAGQKIHENLHTAKVKVTKDILILEGKVHNTVVNFLKGDETESAPDKHEDLKPHESKNLEDTENTSEKATNHNTDDTLYKKPDVDHQITGYGKVANNDNTENTFDIDKINKLSSNNHNTDDTLYKKPDVNHKIIGYGKVANDNTENTFDIDKISKLASSNNHRGTVNQADGNRNSNDDGTDQFHVVYDQNGKAIVVPNTDSLNTHSNMRYGTSVNHSNEHNSFPVNNNLYDDNENMEEKQHNYKVRRTEDGYIHRTAVARSGATARNSGSIDVRNG